MPIFRGEIMNKFIEFLENAYKSIEEEQFESVIDGIVKRDNKIYIRIDNSKQAKNEMLSDIDMEIYNILRLIKTPEEEIMLKKEIFDDFKILSDYLELANLNVSDIYQVITFFIKRNIKADIRDNAITIDMNLLRKLTFETIDTNEVLSKITNGEINDFINREEEELTELEQKQVAELISRLPEFTRDLDKSYKHNTNFNKYILEKFPNIFLEDILEAKIALKGLNCTESIVDKVVLYLLKVYEKNIKNQTEVLDVDLNEVYINVLFPLSKDESGKYIHDENYSKNMYQQNLINEHNKAIAISNRPETPKVPEKKYLTEEDVRVLQKYIRKFYSLYSLEIKAIPTHDELLHVIDNMEKLEVDSLEIRRYLTDLIRLIELPTFPQNFVTSEDELLTIANRLIKYKVEGKYIELFIRTYHNNFHKTYDNAIEEYLD